MLGTHMEPDMAPAALKDEQSPPTISASQPTETYAPYAPYSAIPNPTPHPGDMDVSSNRPNAAPPRDAYIPTLEPNSASVPISDDQSTPALEPAAIPGSNTGNSIAPVPDINRPTTEPNTAPVPQPAQQNTPSPEPNGSPMLDRIAPVPHPAIAPVPGANTLPTEPNAASAPQSPQLSPSGPEPAAFQMPETSNSIVPISEPATAPLPDTYTPMAKPNAVFVPQSAQQNTRGHEPNANSAPELSISHAPSPDAAQASSLASHAPIAELNAARVPQPDDQSAPIPRPNGAPTTQPSNGNVPKPEPDAAPTPTVMKAVPEPTTPPILQPNEDTTRGAARAPSPNELDSLLSHVAHAPNSQPATARLTNGMICTISDLTLKHHLFMSAAHVPLQPDTACAF